MTAPSAALIRLTSRGLLACGAVVAILTFALWILPIEVAQTWAVQRAGADEFEKFEAFGAATATVWLLRVLFVVAGVVLSGAWMFRRRIVPVIASIVTELGDAFAIPSAPIRSLGIRLMVIAWLGLAVYHAGASVQRRLWDWPVFRLYPGATVLPNISSSNREVIRYLESATPSGSRILVLSDQKLFFLSYYLLPRRLYHPTHPESAYVIPKPYNQRQLAAYQWTDLDSARIQRLQPDYVLEYFEGAPYTRDRDLQQDSGWVDFQRRRLGPDWRPSYLVALRRWTPGDVP